MSDLAKDIYQFSRELENYCVDNMRTKLEDLSHQANEEIQSLTAENARLREACMDFFQDYVAEEMEGRPEPEKVLWSIGQEAYIASTGGE